MQHYTRQCILGGECRKQSVCMHALQELSDAAAVLSEGSLVGPLDRQRRLRWAERLQVTQSSLPTQVSTCPLAARLRRLWHMSVIRLPI